MLPIDASAGVPIITHKSPVAPATAEFVHGTQHARVVLQSVVHTREELV